MRRLSSGSRLRSACGRTTLFLKRYYYTRTYVVYACHTWWQTLFTDLYTSPRLRLSVSDFTKPCFAWGENYDGEADAYSIADVANVANAYGIPTSLPQASPHVVA